MIKRPERASLFTIKTNNFEGEQRQPMGQSLVKNYLHIVFSTKYRHPFITDDIETELFSYLGGICNRLECQTVIVGGFRDHIHILCFLSKKIALMKLMEEVKGHSSKCLPGYSLRQTGIKTRGNEFNNFYWQNGYGAFSVKPKEVDRLIQYIRNQREHHSGENFQDEYSLFLEENEMEYDEQYLWD